MKILQPFLLSFCLSLAAYGQDGVLQEKQIIDYFRCISSNVYQEGFKENEIDDHYKEALGIGNFLAHNSTIVDDGFYCQLGKVYFKLNYLDTAEYWYRVAYDMDSTNSVYISNMATIMFSQENYEEALVYFKKSHVVNPNVMDFINNIAACYGSLGYYEQSVDWSIKSLKLSEKGYSAIVAYESLIISYGQLENIKEVRYYQRKLKRLRRRQEQHLNVEKERKKVRCPKPIEALEQFGLED